MPFYDKNKDQLQNLPCVCMTCYIFLAIKRSEHIHGDKKPHKVQVCVSHCQSFISNQGERRSKSVIFHFHANDYKFVERKKYLYK